MKDAFGYDYWKSARPYLTPPYITAEPEVLCRDLHPSNGEQLKFLIIATDGLWDRMSSEEASLLMSAQLNNPHSGDVTKTLLPTLHKHAPLAEKRPLPAEPAPGSVPENNQGSWSFGDDNAAIHLIRDCLGPADGFERQRLLSMKDNGVRGFRDDITAIVVQFDEPAGVPPSIVESTSERLAFKHQKTWKDWLTGGWIGLAVV